MEELYSILTHKLKLVNSKMDFKLMTVGEKDALLDTLLVQKKKESLRILVQTRLQQAIATRHIVADDEIGEICKRSHQIMIQHVPRLNLPENVNHISGIVGLFMEFFTEVGCSLRSQEIRNMYDKRLCPKSLMVATLFNWFVEWARKLFKQFLKTNIHSLYVNSRQPIHFTHDVEQQPSKSEGKLLFFQDVHKKSIIHNREHFVSEKKEPRYHKELPKSLQSLRIMSSRQSLQSKNESTQELLPINREVFLFAYAEELQMLYRNVQPCIPDLQAGWARRLKRGSRRQQVLKRITEIAASCIKQMPITKRTIELYNQQFSKGHPSPSLQNKKEKRLKTQIAKHVQQNISCKGGAKKKKKKYSIALGYEEERHSQIFQINKFSKINDFSLEKYDQNRNISTSQQLLNDRKRRIFSSFAHQKRYQVESEDGKQSNLLVPPSSQRRGQSRKHSLSFQVSHKTLDLSLDPIPQQQKVFFINEGKMTHDLQIIQQRVRKMKARVLHGRPLRGSISKNKANDKRTNNKDLYKSIQSDRPNVQEFRRIANTIQITQKVALKLPKIKKTK